jgi:hypothetical protein
MTRLQIAVALYTHQGCLPETLSVERAFDLAEEFIAEEKSRQDYDLHIEREKNEAPNDDGVPF